MITTEDFCSCLEDHYNSKMPFVAFRSPNADNVTAFLQQDDTLNIVSDFSESGFVFAPFDDKEDAILLPKSLCKQIQTTYFNSDCKSYQTLVKSEKYQLNSKVNHTKLIQKALESIYAGEFKKVVLSRFELIKLRKNNPLKLFSDLLETYKKAFVYCWYHPKVGLWLGATPETLLKVEGNQFETMSLAGTQVYNGTLNVDWKKKEREEQQYVTDFIVNRLKHKVKSLKVSHVETLKAGNVLHLLTRISGTLKLDKYSFKSFIAELHPTPATCGIPKNDAKHFILKNENYNREFYTGFLGELNIENNCNLFVNLRCMQLKKKEAIIYVGGGITRGSIPENEWFETVNKTNTIKKVLL